MLSPLSFATSRPASQSWADINSEEGSPRGSETDDVPLNKHQLAGGMTCESDSSPTSHVDQNYDSDDGSQLCVAKMQDKQQLDDNSGEVHQARSSTENKKKDPLPSVGSKPHLSGRCKPCAFLHTKGCQQGTDCAFCHLCPPREKLRRKRLKQQLSRSIKSSLAQDQDASLHLPLSLLKGSGATRAGHSRQASSASTVTPSLAGSASASLGEFGFDEQWPFFTDASVPVQSIQSPLATMPAVTPAGLVNSQALLPSRSSQPFAKGPTGNLNTNQNGLTFPHFQQNCYSFGFVHPQMQVWPPVTMPNNTVVFQPVPATWVPVQSQDWTHFYQPAASTGHFLEPIREKKPVQPCQSKQASDEQNEEPEEDEESDEEDDDEDESDEDADGEDEEDDN